MARCDSVTVSIAELTIGNVHGDVPGQARARVGFGRQHVAARRLEKYVVEGEAFQNRFLDHEGVIPLSREPIP